MSVDGPQTDSRRYHIDRMSNPTTSIGDRRATVADEGRCPTRSQHATVIEGRCPTRSQHATVTEGHCPTHSPINGISTAHVRPDTVATREMMLVGLAPNTLHEVLSLHSTVPPGSSQYHCGSSHWFS